MKKLIDLSNLDLIDSIKEKIVYYLSYSKEEDKQKIRKAIDDNDLNLLKKWFSSNLEFGTGGLREIMDIGTSYLNEVTISKAAYATLDFFCKEYDREFYNKNDISKKSICISYDTRKNSDIFAKISALIAVKKGFHVYITKDPMPTPFLSFLVRETKSFCGIMITASHNPKNYNGFKVYDKTGCQILSDMANKIIEIYNSSIEMEKIDLLDFEILINKKKIEYVKDSFIDDFIGRICTVKYNKNLENNKKLLNVVYSSLHGTGINIFKKLEEKIGFNTFYVESQIEMNNDFPNVKSLNPENLESFEQALKIAKENNSDLIVITDPDADRVRFAFLDENRYFIPTGNELAVMLFYYICSQIRLSEIDSSIKKEINEDYFSVTTVVTTDLLEIIGRYFGVEVFKTLTGFKYIGQVINKNENKKFLFAAEESCGYLVTGILRDKDAFSMIVLILEFLSYLKSQKIHAKNYLKKIYEQFGYYLNDLVNIDFSEKKDKDIIDKIMIYLRENPLEAFCNFKIRKIFDFENNIESFPKSNLLQYIGENFKVTVRPSGTEPKLKIYFQVVSHNEIQSKEILETFKNFFINLIKTECLNHVGS
ncbi:MAG: phospho-sugar mutase [Spirochaetales bacterium]|nr:phospho-sugar mutase [Spirochaetales bacterium]